MNCLYSGDKPLGIVQSNAEDVAYDNNTSVKEKIDSLGTLYHKTVSGTTDNNGILTTDLLATGYIYIGTTTTNSVIVIPVCAMSDGKIRIRIMDAGTLQPRTSEPYSFECYFIKLPS